MKSYERMEKVDFLFQNSVFFNDSGSKSFK